MEYIYERNHLAETKSNDRCGGISSKVKAIDEPNANSYYILNKKKKVDNLILDFTSYFNLSCCNFPGGNLISK